MKQRLLPTVGILLGTAAIGAAQNDAADLRKDLDALRSDYEQRINRLEQRIRELESGSETEGRRSVSTKPAPPAQDPAIAAAREREAGALA
ncbi:MAG: hypothetical protein J0M04_10320, partial [Verrucomicrobia bacterium]|nr:hypothetical protein [Verrucomicrobiota bacterium]